MAMTIMNNPSAMLTLGELNKNVSKLGKQLKKVSSGMKINSAGDDASGYAISERMRAQIRGLNQDTQNVQNGKSLLRVAEGGIQSIIEEIRTLKELALNSANDTNTDLDRATIQKEFENRKANINDIATETNYNGKTLLDGTYKRPEGWDSSNGSGSGSGTSTPSIGPTAINGPTGVVEPNGAVTMITSGNYTIASDGVYMLADGYTGKVTIADGAKNVKIQQQTPSAALHDVSIVGPASGEANLWIEDLNITNYNANNTNDISVIQFRGSFNVLTVKGTNNLTFERNDDASRFGHAAIVNVGGGLTIEGSAGGTLNVALISNVYNNLYSIAGIGCDGHEYSNADIVINSGNINVDFASSTTVSSYNGETYRVGTFGACIGSAGGGVDYTTLLPYERSDTGVHDIIINGGTINVKNALSGAGIGSGYYADVNDIVINGGNITADCDWRTEGISGGGLGCAIGTGNGGLVNNIYIDSSASISADVCEPFSTAPLAGPCRDGSTSSEYEAMEIGKTTSGVMLGQVFYDGVPVSESSSNISDSSHKGGNPLVIHHGTKANQALNVYINDMHTWSLKTDVPSDDDILELGRLDTAKAAAYQAVLNEAQNMTLDDAKVVTQHDANVALRVIDGALQYALNEVTTVGAYCSRLDFTESNLVTANESTQASESTLRDADMAKEMAEYTKANVLAQAAQSMLAQANQNSSSVLSLLQ